MSRLFWSAPQRVQGIPRYSRVYCCGWDWFADKAYRRHLVVLGDVFIKLCTHAHACSP